MKESDREDKPAIATKRISLQVEQPAEKCARRLNADQLPALQPSRAPLLSRP
ncbi:MAG: hypothetical protein HYY24_21245 [Verrucomicrobia bacterium]|nr:hypothetical protein [Verrucomicrobiota bacterium]